MRCECCNTRAATETHTIHRAKVDDVYRLCRWCYCGALGLPAPVSEVPDRDLRCVACHRTGNGYAGLCRRCNDAMRGAVKRHRAGEAVHPETAGGHAALMLDLGAATSWTIYADLIHLRCVLRGRLAAK